MVEWVETIRNPMVIPKKNASKSCEPIKNTQVFVDWLALLVFPETLLALGSKKKELMPELSETLILSEQTTTLELDELWSFVLKKANKDGFRCFVQANSTSRGICYRQPIPLQLAPDYGRKSRQSFGKYIVFPTFWEAYQMINPFVCLFFLWNILSTANHSGKRYF